MDGRYEAGGEQGGKHPSPFSQLQLSVPLSNEKTSIWKKEKLKEKPIAGHKRKQDGTRGLAQGVCGYSR